jgi:hypothetical protein
MNLKRPSAALATTLILCASAVAQTASPPEPGAAATPGQSNSDRRDPSTATPSTINRPPPTRDVQENSSPNSDADMSATVQHRPKAGREAKLGRISAGSLVQSPAGEPIGRVEDIVPDTRTGEPAYVVISSRSGSTAVPYATIAPMFQDDHIVLDRSRLEAAPQLRDGQLLNRSDATWKQAADRYWESRKPPSLR